MKKNKKVVSENSVCKLAIVVLVVLATSLSLLCIGAIRLNHINLNSIKEFNENRNIFKVVDKDLVEVDISKFADLIELDVSEESVRLYDVCHESCNVKVNFGGINYYYIISKNYFTGNYSMTIAKDNKAIIYNKSIGNSIINLQLLYYLGYLTLYNTYNDDTFNYDYAISVDSNNNYDEFSSLNANEMEFSGKGIIYYYDLCEDNKSYKIKAIRKPLSEVTSILSKTEDDFKWCVK